MSVSNVMLSGLSALSANQSALRATSSNIANANTPGYTRLNAQFENQALAGQSAGVQALITRVSDRFLASTHINSISDAARYDVSAGLLDRAQAFLGDPSAGGSVFSSMDQVLADLSSLGADPTSSLRQATAIGSLSQTFTDVQRAYQDIDALRTEADLKITATVDEANGIMEQLASLNAQISRAETSGADATGASTQQSQLIDRLAEIMDVRVTERSLGGVEVRTNSGLLLVDNRAATLSRNGGVNGERFRSLDITPPGSTGSIGFETQVRGGELRGLLSARDGELTGLANDLGEFAAGLAGALNAAHNASASVPPPTSLAGRNTGLLAGDALNFSGQSQIAITDSSGRLVQRVDVDFDAGTINNGGGPVAFGGTVGGFTTALNTALGGNGSASFTNGQLTISANGTDGVAIADPTAAPSSRSGRGFSEFFGLNDVVRQASPSFFDTGLSGTDAHGFTPGDTMTLAIRNEDGNIIRTVDYTIAGATFDDIVTGLNDVTVLGGYGTASFDADGRLTITPTNAPGVGSIDVVADQTSRGTTNLALSELFGLSSAGRSNRAMTLGIDPAIASNPARLATATAALAGANVGDRVLTPGDTSGVDRLLAAPNTPRVFGSGSATMTASVSDFGSSLAASAGLMASAFESRSTAALSLRDEAMFRRQSVEGVNLDEEMVNMTTYQQGYAAASRLIQTAQEMYDTLLNMV